MNIPEGKRLGKLCPNRHDWNGTGKSLRYVSSRSCFECQKERQMGYREANKEQYLEHRKGYYNTNKIAILGYYKTENGKKSHSKSSKKYNKQHPNRVCCRSRLVGAIKSGKIIKEPCIICDSENVHGHHSDYSKPLDVIWLCPLHHKAIHIGEIDLKDWGRI